MASCIVHIGMHKTGSTSIQQSLNGYSDCSCLYARIGNDANHSLAIFSLFSDHPEKHPLHGGKNSNIGAVRDYVNRMHKELKRAILAANGRSLILSGEDITTLRQAELIKLRDYFKKHFGEIVVVGYVRPPAEYMASAFQERVKGGSVINLKLEQTYPQFRRIFSKFDHVFGRNNVKLWKFDPKFFPSGCVVQDFCKRLGIDFPVKRISRANDSLSRQAVTFLFIYRKFGKAYNAETMMGGEGHRLGKLLEATGRDKFRFSPDILLPELKKNRADIEWMEARLGQPLNELLNDHQPGDVRDESDLLHVSPLMFDGLLKLLGNHAPNIHRNETPQEIALLVHALRCLNASDIEGCKNVSTSAPLLENCSDEIESITLLRQWKSKLLRLVVARKALHAVSQNGSLKPNLTRRGDVEMKLIELLKLLKNENPKLLPNFPEEKAVALLRAAFVQLRKQIDEMSDGILLVPGLGNFKIAVVEREKDGKKVTNKHIVFRPSNPKEKI